MLERNKNPTGGTMSAKKIGYTGKGIILIVLLLCGKYNVLSDVFVLWVWVVYLVSLISTYYLYAFLNTGLDFVRIYLTKSGETNRKTYKMLNPLLPDSIRIFGLFWSVLNILSFGWILKYQGLVPVIFSEVLLYILMLILPVNYKYYTNAICKHLDKLLSPTEIENAGFKFEEIKSIVEKAVNNNIDTHKWWLEIKEGIKKEN